jgi:hypothetical protein
LFLPLPANYEQRGRLVAADFNHDGVPRFLIGIYDTQVAVYRTAVLLSNP